MNIRQPRYSKAEHARRGNDIYERLVRPHVETGNLGKIVAIDVDTGAFEVAEDTLTASQRLLARYPDARESSHPPRVPMRLEACRRLRTGLPSCGRLRRVQVCGPVPRAHRHGNCLHIKHKKCKILCYKYKPPILPC